MPVPAVLDGGYAKLAPDVRRAYRFLGSLPEREMLFCGATGLLTFGATADALGWFTDLKQSARTARDDHDEGRGAFGQALCHHQDARADPAPFCLGQAITLWDACGNHEGTALASLTASGATLDGGDLPRATAWPSTCSNRPLPWTNLHDPARRPPVCSPGFPDRLARTYQREEIRVRRHGRPARTALREAPLP
ncbi:hypothetical protein ACWDR0_07910 [Streptomyces sp. NPDC003691]